MPRLNTDYSKTIIYKLVCNDTNITDIYVGSTTNFTKRKANHKKSCINENDKKHNLKVYKIIRANGGWFNWSMIEVEKFPCNDRREAEARERYHYELLQANLNSCCPFRTTDERLDQKKEYNKQNKEQINEYKKQYKAENKEKIAEKNKQYREQNKDIISKKKKEYREHNKDKITEKKNQYYEQNKDKISEYNKQYCEQNKEQIKQYREKNKDKISEYQKQYREKNKDKISEYNKQYREKNKK